MDPEKDYAQIKVSEEMGYILVKPPKGITLWEILAAIGRLISQDGFFDKNDYRIFEDDAVSFTSEDLRVIKEYGVNHYPKSAEPKKEPLSVKPIFKERLQKHTSTPVSNIPVRYRYL